MTGFVPNHRQILKLIFMTFNNLIQKGNADVIDVREPNEIPVVNEFSNISIPLAQLADNSFRIKSDTVIAFCQTGNRSLHAAIILKKFGGNQKNLQFTGRDSWWKSGINHHERKKA